MTHDELTRVVYDLQRRVARLEARTSGTMEAVRVSPDDPRAEPAPSTESQRLARVARRRPSAPAVAAVVDASAQLDTIARATERLRDGLPQISRGLFHDDEGES